MPRRNYSFRQEFSELFLRQSGVAFCAFLHEGPCARVRPGDFGPEESFDWRVAEALVNRGYLHRNRDRSFSITPPGMAHLLGEVYLGKTVNEAKEYRDVVRRVLDGGNWMQFEDIDGACTELPNGKAVLWGWRSWSGWARWNGVGRSTACGRRGRFAGTSDDEQAR